MSGLRLRARFDAVAGRVTMYRLVVILLVVLVVAAYVASLAGGIGYAPLALTEHLAVAVVSTVLTSWLVALPFRVRFHLDSALITGLLLFFLLLPSTDPGDLLLVALAGLVASASKFVIAWRGRHILNPAATGLLVVWFFFHATSGWWVGTAALLPIVTIASLIVLYRTRRLSLGVTFVVVAVVVSVVRYASTGLGVADALQFVLVQSPIVFFAGFMLSEPLTLPPRRWQQLVVAGVAGVLISVPFSFGSLETFVLSTSPQVALVVANIVAFAFGQRRGMRLELVSTRSLAADVTEFTFRALRRPVRFAAGQYIELDLPHRGVDARGRRRVFSISSAPGDGHEFTVAMSMPSEDAAARTSSFKRALAALEPGARLHATSVAGDFALPAADVPVLLVAGGIGITPFASQLAASPRADVTVVYATSSTELPYRDVLEASDARVVLVAPEAPDDMPDGWSYAGPGRVTRELLAAEVPDAAARRAFVSGPPALVSDVRAMLRSLGARRITTDYFTGY